MPRWTSILTSLPHLLETSASYESSQNDPMRLSIKVCALKARCLDVWFQRRYKRCRRRSRSGRAQPITSNNGGMGGRHRPRHPKARLSMASLTPPPSIPPIFDQAFRLIPSKTHLLNFRRFHNRGIRFPKKLKDRGSCQIPSNDVFSNLP